MGLIKLALQKIQTTTTENSPKNEIPLLDRISYIKMDLSMEAFEYLYLLQFPHSIKENAPRYVLIKGGTIEFSDTCTNLSDDEIKYYLLLEFSKLTNGFNKILHIHKTDIFPLIFIPNGFIKTNFNKLFSDLKSYSLIEKMRGSTVSEAIYKESSNTDKDVYLYRQQVLIKLIQKFGWCFSDLYLNKAKTSLVTYIKPKILTMSEQLNLPFKHNNVEWKDLTYRDRLQLQPIFICIAMLESLSFNPMTNEYDFTTLGLRLKTPIQEDKLIFRITLSMLSSVVRTTDFVTSYALGMDKYEDDKYLEVYLTQADLDECKIKSELVTGKDVTEVVYDYVVDKLSTIPKDLQQNLYTDLSQTDDTLISTINVINKYIDIPTNYINSLLTQS